MQSGGQYCSPLLSTGPADEHNNGFKNDVRQHKTCLLLAVEDGLLAIVKVLLRHGAQPTRKDMSGRSILQLAEDNEKMLTFLLDWSCDNRVELEWTDCLELEDFDPLGPDNVLYRWCAFCSIPRPPARVARSHLSTYVRR